MSSIMSHTISWLHTHGCLLQLSPVHFIGFDQMLHESMGVDKDEPALHNLKINQKLFSLPKIRAT